MVCTSYMYRDFTNLFPQLSAVESLHTRHYIQRDIKPGNVMIRADSTAFLIDFGLAKLFRDPATHLHRPYSTSCAIVGTLPFTSINGQQGHAQSRCDDLESLAYTIIFSARGDLPWSNLSNWEAVLQKNILSQKKSYVWACPLLSKNLSVTSVPLALARSLTINTFILSSCNAHKARGRLTYLTKHWHSLSHVLAPLLSVIRCKQSPCM